jgi:hypothetical protein
VDLVAKGVCDAQRTGFFAALMNLVAKGGIEPPTRGFSIRCSTN